MAKGALTLPWVASEVLKALPHLVKLPSKQFWIDCDVQADVLYISFERPQKATDTRPIGDHLLLRYRGRKLVGLTVLHSSTFLKQAA
jgi:uncharacterized protein YuzE